MRITEAIGLQTARKPNFVLDDHSSRRHITGPLQQPTRRFWLLPASRQTGLSAWAHRADTRSSAWRGAADSLPIWSCSVWGLPCRSTYAGRGALLPHLFTLTFCRVHDTLTCIIDRRRYILCCTGRPEGLNPPSRTLSGTLPCGVRTFLPRQTPCDEDEDGSDHPAACPTSVPQRTRAAAKALHRLPPELSHHRPALLPQLLPVPDAIRHVL